MKLKYHIAITARESVQPTDKEILEV